MFRNWHRAALTAGGLLLALTACSSTGTSTTTAKTSTPPMASMSSMPAASGTSATSGTKIVIDHFAYAPMDLTVSPGQKVTVVNNDSTAHTLTADNKKFDTGSIGPGKSGSFTAPTTPGSYTYICSIHQFMHGTVTVH
ncbi:cupredoxin domain-containing protein [Streptacidiphilus sp. PAMC 29251]